MENSELPKVNTQEQLNQEAESVVQENKKTVVDDETKINSINESVKSKEKIVEETQNQINDIRMQLDIGTTSEIPPSVLIEQNSINKLNEEKTKFDFKTGEVQPLKDEEVENTEFNSMKEEWRKAAEDRFGIKDFNLSIFKRIILDEEKTTQVFNAGKDWDYIYSDLDNFVKGESYDQATKSFETMGDLEKSFPGSVKILHEKYGISNFQRYPKEILINQLVNNKENKNTGLLLFAESDYNGAFDSQKLIWEKIYNNKKNDLNFKIIECNSTFSLARQLLLMKENNEKISLAVLSAHGDEEGFSLSENEQLSKSSFSKFNENLKELFNNNAQLLANACSSGAINGWVQQVSKTVRLEATGPDRPAGIGDVDFYNGKIVPEYYKNDINSNYKNGFLLSKKDKSL